MDEKEGSEMQEEMMTVLVVEPMKAPYVKNIPNELEELQQAVGGDIEMTYPFDDKVGILLNGNGKFEGLPLNRALYDDHGQVYDPASLVKKKFLMLTYSHIEYVLHCMSGNTTKVKNIKKYLLAALFNAPSTMNGYYQTEVNHDMPGLVR